MNAWVLNNSFYRFQCNEQKAIVGAKAYATQEWDQLKSDAL
jgi:hypothetical protein